MNPHNHHWELSLKKVVLSKIQIKIISKMTIKLPILIFFQNLKRHISSLKYKPWCYKVSNESAKRSLITVSECSCIILNPDITHPKIHCKIANFDFFLNLKRHISSPEYSPWHSKVSIESTEASLRNHLWKKLYHPKFRQQSSEKSP